MSAHRARRLPQVNVVWEEKQRGVDVKGLVAAVQKLADAQSRRSAVAAQVLPGV